MPIKIVPKEDKKTSGNKKRRALKFVKKWLMRAVLDDVQLKVRKSAPKRTGVRKSQSTAVGTKGRMV
jgi:hypothetical protein